MIWYNSHFNQRIIPVASLKFNNQFNQKANPGFVELSWSEFETIESMIDGLFIMYGWH